jgi:hypothetical protein
MSRVPRPGVDSERAGMSRMRELGDWIASTGPVNCRPLGVLRGAYLTHDPMRPEATERLAGRWLGPRLKGVTRGSATTRRTP